MAKKSTAKVRQNPQLCNTEKLGFCIGSKQDKTQKQINNK